MDNSQDLEELLEILDDAKELLDSVDISETTNQMIQHMDRLKLRMDARFDMIVARIFEIENGL